MQKAYNTFTQLVTEYQSHSGAVNVSQPQRSVRLRQGQREHGSADEHDVSERPRAELQLRAPEGFNDATSLIGSLIDDDGVTHLADYVPGPARSCRSTRRSRGSSTR